MEERPVVLLHPAVRPFPTGAVEPLLEKRPVAAVMDAAEGPGVFLIILRRPVCGIVPVPGRDIDTHLQPGRGAGLGELLQDIPVPVPPAALPHGMAAFGAWPEAEAVMVLRREDDALHPRPAGYVGPLAAVKGRGVEEVLRLRPEAPFPAAEGVGAEVDKEVHLHLLPLQLRAGGHRTAGGRRLDAG